MLTPGLVLADISSIALHHNCTDVSRPRKEEKLGLSLRASVQGEEKR